jgi:hypothetical protein
LTESKVDDEELISAFEIFGGGDTGRNAMADNTG